MKSLALFLIRSYRLLFRRGRFHFFSLLHLLPGAFYDSKLSIWTSYVPAKYVSAIILAAVKKDEAGDFLLKNYITFNFKLNYICILQTKLRGIMKSLISRSLVLLIVLAVFAGCSKKEEKPTTDKDSKKTETVKKEFTTGIMCLLDGKEFSMNDGDSFARKDDKSLSIYANIQVDKGQYDDVFIIVKAPPKAGEFALDKSSTTGHLQYRTNKDKPKGSEEYDQYWSDNGKVVITKVDDAHIEGTFTASTSATLEDGSAKKLEVKDGKFNLKFK